MESATKRILFLTATILLVLVVVIGSVVITLRGPRESSVELLEKQEDGTLLVNDLYEGHMTIPFYNIPKCTYEPDDFSDNKGVIAYEGGDSYVGINVNQQQGEIDWSQVAGSGVDFVLIRVGYRMYGTGRIVEDERFEANIQGALEAGLPVGVYFYSKAISTTEAEEEANFVLDKIRTYTVTYPVFFYWRYDLKDDGSLMEESRVTGCNGDQITSFAEAFCAQVTLTGRTAGFFCDKTMGYERLDLSRLSAYDMWYTEFRAAPSFYYDFKMWQYTDEGTVPGISQQVPITLSMKKYG